MTFCWSILQGFPFCQFYQFCGDHQMNIHTNFNLTLFSSFFRGKDWIVESWRCMTKAQVLIAVWNWYTHMAPLDIWLEWKWAIISFDPLSVKPKTFKLILDASPSKLCLNYPISMNSCQYTKKEIELIFILIRYPVVPWNVIMVTD
jgi:hypothetical protein